MLPVPRFCGFSRSSIWRESPTAAPAVTVCGWRLFFWAADYFHRSVPKAKANTGWRSPYEMLISRLPALPWTRATMEVHHFFFCGSSFSELKTSPKTRFLEKKYNCYRMKGPTSMA